MCHVEDIAEAGWARLGPEYRKAIIPTLVSRDRRRLEQANGRLGAVMTAGQQLAGPPLGGVVFTVAAWLPFGADAVSFVASAALVASVRGRFAAGQPAAGSPRGLQAEIAEGLRFLLAHRVLRTPAGMVGAFALVEMAGVAILVLFAQQELGLGSVGFGLLLAAVAVGGLPGDLLGAAVGQRLPTHRLRAGAGRRPARRRAGPHAGAAGTLRAPRGGPGGDGVCWRCRR